MKPNQTEDPPWATELEHPGDWALMVRLLTLDVTRAMRGHLGLEVSDHDALVRVLRDAVQAEPEVDDAAPPSRLGEEALRRVEAALGRDEAQALYDWGARAFRHAFRDKRGYDFWNILLGQCRWNDALWAALGLPPRHGEVLKNRFLNSQEDSRFMADHHKATEGELSPWDLRMQLDDAFHDEGKDPGTPEILLGRLAAVQRSREFWRWVVGTLTTPQLDELRRNAKALTESQPQLSFIDALADPVELADLGAPDSEPA